MSTRVLIVDFGSQTTQLIARRVRELGFYCEIKPYNAPEHSIRDFAPDAVILSGGPASVHLEDSPALPFEAGDFGVPILGICYGMQWMTQSGGGEVQASPVREFGRATLDIVSAHALFDGIESGDVVWMSHGDKVVRLSEGTVTLASTTSCEHAVVWNEAQRFVGAQFHPEVVHSLCGTRFLKNFLVGFCELTPDWKMSSFIDDKVAEIRKQVGEGSVLLGLSGGVDSTVAAALLYKAIGERLTCVYVEHGLQRKNETEEVETLFKECFTSKGEGKLVVVRASERFMKDLSGVSDPERKRKTIGHTFIDVFSEEANKLSPKPNFLAQGTLYPDVVESISAHGGPNAVIKSHHNVGGLPEKMDLELVEPLRELFKDEVRVLGLELGLPASWVARQPFPGPGLAIRIVGELLPERFERLREADAIVREEIDKTFDALADKPWQWFAVLLPIKSVGVMGDGRTYEETICIRSVSSVDGMTADWTRLPHELLGRMSTRIINEVSGINRVVYDISSKPPSTIEWE